MRRQPLDPVALLPVFVVVTTALGSLVGLTGCDGGGPSTADAGPEPAADAGPFKIAAHPAPPQVVESGGGTVLAAPKVIPVYFADEANRTDVDQLLTELAATNPTYWNQVTAEYGVGDLSVGSAITLDQIGPGSMTEEELVGIFEQKLNGPVDPNAIYMFMIPKQTTFGSPFGGECCSSFGGYHDGNFIQQTPVATAFICTCAGSPPGLHFPSSLDEVAITISHELAEAATDPDGFSGFNTVDDDHQVYGFLGGGEIGDMCEFLAHSEIQIPGIHLPVQRIWSNKSAKADQDPCVPALSDEVFFAAVPDVKDTLQFADGQGGTTTAKGIRIAEGETRTVDLRLYSQGPIDSWGVTVIDAAGLFGGEPAVTLTLRDNHGTNGDVLPLDITVNKANFSSGEIFIVQSVFEKSETMAVGLIGQR